LAIIVLVAGVMARKNKLSLDSVWLDRLGMVIAFLPCLPVRQTNIHL
jgi:hypothetical protein